ncbi:TetR/AcrR family transcriptional regulator [Nonomuraea endophytica]|uniref:AcrR family transcriptional regulator n=1 Tax=Nonomuraea endophytica TaxID=714136 RepID=A0A7W8EFR8_9ACTN|nr:TetR/AcrR family transcriptional regulator [Nonomuraea endophytica]MBB5077651.1 AcrR family transcriptional regulator [Nonomuraea endophytica]
MPVESSRMELRADARHNRERIIKAAGELIAARGLDVPMAAIARRAGVGVATLYRRFPTREALMVELFHDRLAVCLAGVDAALEDPDPWRGFRTYIENLCAMNAVDRGLAAAFLTEFRGAVDFERERARAEQGFAELVRRAKAAGQLRAEFDRSDLSLILMATDGITAASAETAVAAARRLAGLMLRSFHTGPAAPLPPPAPLALYHLSVPD